MAMNSVIPVEINPINTYILTLKASEFCWLLLSAAQRQQGLSSGSPGQRAVYCTYKLFSSGQQEYYLEFLASRCPLLLCLYSSLLIVWQDWQALLQSWLKALRSEKWDRYRANTCPLCSEAVPYWACSPSMAPLRANMDFFLPPQLTMLLWLANNPSHGSSSFHFPLLWLQFLSESNNYDLFIFADLSFHFILVKQKTNKKTIRLPTKHLPTDYRSLMRCFEFTWSPSKEVTRMFSLLL